MAKNVKNKKKKRSNYDDKIIKVIAISLIAALVVIVTSALIVSYTGSYVAKVDGERVMKYEYEYFLTNTMYEMKNEAIENGTLAEDADAAAIADFWSAERKKEAENKALEEAKKWKAQYILADKAGFSLNYDERYEYKQNIEYQIYSTYSQYSSYYDYDEYVKLYLGMELEEYQDIAIQSAAISDYKADMKKAYSATDEELKALYDETPDDYRMIKMSVLALEKPDALTEVTKPSETKEDGTAKTEDSMTAAEWAEYQADLTEYNEYLEAKKEYDAEIKALEERYNAIYDAMNNGGKYTEEKEETDSETSSETTDGDAAAATDTAESTETESEDAYVYKDATLADIAAKEGALYADNNGEVEINALTKSGYDVLDELALSMQWKDAERKAIVSKTTDESGTEVIKYGENGETVDGVTYTDYIKIDDDDYYYIVRCIGIEDFENSTESEAGAADSVKDQVRDDLYEDKAEAELDKMITDAGNKYNVEKKKQSAIDEIVKSVSWS
ncbi:MAG: hypothetical protein IJZ94_06010 [Clostridia bacterium]|nr:hypothetical protein [Clostridia bacterium]